MDQQSDLWETFKDRIPELKNMGERPTKDGPRKREYHRDQDILIKAPIVRAINWNPRFTGARNVAKYADNIAAAMLYIVGTVAEDPCHVCRNGSGPFQGCILPPSGANVARYACANCRWNWKYKGCKHNPNSGDQGNPARGLAALVDPVGEGPARRTRSHTEAARSISVHGPGNVGAEDGEEGESLFVEEDDGYRQAIREYGDVGRDSK
ncbi:hypothetical protein F4775DRAFT_552165 [Biscogniauxia sp. FL1348]|nr:hypothetical protein F4775DRAFT_552165 [Biscogniauxia sp. FL1348]